MSLGFQKSPKSFKDLTAIDLTETRTVRICREAPVASSTATEEKRKKGIKARKGAESINFVYLFPGYL